MENNYIELLESYFIEDPNKEQIILLNEDKHIDYKKRRLICYISMVVILFNSVGFLIYLIIKK
jgi:hypothetical protein